MMVFFEVYTQWFVEQPEPVRQVVSRVFKNRDIYLSNTQRKVIAFNPKK